MKNQLNPFLSNYLRRLSFLYAFPSMRFSLLNAHSPFPYTNLTHPIRFFTISKNDTNNNKIPVTEKSASPSNERLIEHQQSFGNEDVDIDADDDTINITKKIDPVTHSLLVEEEHHDHHHPPATLSPTVSADTPSIRADTKLFTSFLCTKCNTRNAKLISKQAYTSGVVLCKCNGCKALHLFADHLNWFDDERVTVEDICKQRGISFTATDDMNELNEEQRNTLRQTHRITPQKDNS